MNKDHHAHVSIVALSCREAARLISDSQDRALSRREWWALKIHVVLCGACRRFRAHLDLLREAITRMPGEVKSELHTGVVQLSPTRRAQIKRLLARAAASE